MKTEAKKTEATKTEAKVEKTESKAEHTGVAAVVDEVKVVVDDVRERFTREWDTLRTKAQAAFTKLTDEDFEGVKGRFEELRERVVKAYGYAEKHAHDEVAKLMHGGEAPKAAHATAPGPTGSASRKKNRGAKRHAKQAAR
jgi:uncharacterized protein YjbJ (UPF0337 family)